MSQILAVIPHTHVEHANTYIPSTHALQYGKGITAGLILEPAHKQSDRTEEEKGNINAKTNSITKFHIKARACPPTLLFCLFVCVFSHSRTSLISEEGKTWNGTHTHAHKHTLKLNVNDTGFVSLFVLRAFIVCPSEKPPGHWRSSKCTQLF